MRVSTIVGLGSGLLALAGCGGGGDGGSGGSGPGPLKLAKASPSGDAQSGPVVQALPQPLTVILTRDGAPEAGVTVVWSTGGTGASVSPTSSATAADGTASTMWTLSQTAGAQSAQAAVSGANGSPLQFTATAQAGPAAVLTKSGGDGQTGHTGAALPQIVVARVGDQFGNPVAGTTVQWNVTGGGGSVDPASGASNAQGLASTTWTMGGSPGAASLQVTSTGLTGSPLTFTATAITPPPPPTAITIQVQNTFFSPQVDTVAAGGTVTWTWVGQGHNVTSVLSPSFSPASPTSDAPFTFGPITFTTPGTYEYICTVHGVVAGGIPSGMHGTIVVQ